MSCRSLMVASTAASGLDADEDDGDDDDEEDDRVWNDTDAGVEDADEAFRADVEAGFLMTFLGDTGRMNTLASIRVGSALAGLRPAFLVTGASSRAAAARAGLSPTERGALKEDMTPEREISILSFLSCAKDSAVSCGIMWYSPWL